MTDLVVTAANVAPVGASIDYGTAGVAVTAGQVVYKEAASALYKLADSNGVLEGRVAGGIALNSAAAGQPLAVATSGDVRIGGVLSPGAAYYLSETPGGIQPTADLGSGENVCLLGLAKSTSVLALRIMAPGVVL